MLIEQGVSVIIPTFNGLPQVKVLIARLLSQSVKPLEIIVIDSSSSDGTVEVARQMGCRVFVIEKRLFNHGATRNWAANNARGDILIFMTQDALPVNEHLIENLLNPLKDVNVAASFGRQITDEGASPIERFSRAFNYNDRSIVKGYDQLKMLGVKTFFFSNVCSAIKTEAFLKGGAFPCTIMNEDMAFSARLIKLGFKVAYEASAEVVHYHNYTLWKQFRRYFDIGVSMVENSLLDKMHPAGEGRRFVSEGTLFFIKLKSPYWLMYFFVDMLVRYAAYSIGLHYKTLPSSLQKKLSMHTFYFSKH
ncbi:MAG: glycosyltransferase [Candidatus Magnetoovum sp. WYHC-5]|nr:glycosyltransferase [Candidatus Magnetoovum sp. WYHC-5]